MPEAVLNLPKERGGRAETPQPGGSGYYEVRASTTGQASAHRVLAPHANPSPRYTSSSTGDGGGTAERVSFASDPAPYAFARAEAWNGGFLVPGSGFQAWLSYGFSVSGPANGLVPLRFRGQYAISNDTFLTQTGVNFTLSVSAMDYSRWDQIGMEAGCSGGYDGASCYATRDGSPTVNGSIQVTQRLLGVEPVLRGVAVDGGFEGVLMAPTDAAGLAPGHCWPGSPRWCKRGARQRCPRRVLGLHRPRAHDRPRLPGPGLRPR